MKLRSLILVPALFAAAPAAATGGFTCRTTDPAGARITIITGTGEGGIALVTVREGTRFFSSGATGQPIIVGQSRLGDRSILLELLDAQERTTLARLEASRPAGMGNLTGTLELTGRTYRIVCQPEQ